MWFLLLWHGLSGFSDWGVNEICLFWVGQNFYNCQPCSTSSISVLSTLQQLFSGNPCLVHPCKAHQGQALHSYLPLICSINFIFYHPWSLFCHLTLVGPVCSGSTTLYHSHKLSPSLALRESAELTWVSHISGITVLYCGPMPENSCFILSPVLWLFMMTMMLWYQLFHHGQQSKFTW